MGRLHQLRKLTLNGNALQSLPAELAGLSSLQELWLQVRLAPREAARLLCFFSTGATPHMMRV